MNTPADPTARPAAPSPAPVRRRLHVGAAILVLALVPFVAKSLDVNNGLRVGTDPTTHGTTSPYSAKIGHANTGQGPYGLAVGESNYISGNGSFATGSLHYLNGSQLSALGSGHTIKDGNQQSVAMGLNNTINPLCDQSVAAGSHNLVAGRQNIALGTGLTTKSYRSVVLGSWNEHLPSVDATGWVSTNPLFIIGNGNGINNDPNKQSNALVIGAGHKD